MKSEETLALLVGASGTKDRGAASAGELLARVATEVIEVESPGDALDALLARAGVLPPSGRTLLVIDQRGSERSECGWIRLLKHLDLGPVILLVDDDRPDLEAAARRAGVSRCIEDRQVTRHPGLLVRSARRALELRGAVAAGSVS